MACTGDDDLTPEQIHLLREGMVTYDKIGDPNGSHIKFNRNSLDPESRLQSHIILLESLKRSMEVTAECLERKEARIQQDGVETQSLRLTTTLDANRIADLEDELITVKKKCSLWGKVAIFSLVGWSPIVFLAGYLLATYL
jgi:hypothetical protein